MSETRFRSGMLVFPNLTQLDLTGPYEVLARLPGAETLLLWKSLDPAVLSGVLARAEPRQRDRAERVARAAAALG